MGLICSCTVCMKCPMCPCCGYSVKAHVRQEIKDVLKTWMQRLAEVAPLLRLKDIAMMSSHDCGTYSISKHKLGSSVSRTQEIDVYHQLDLGIRQIDFRYGPVGKGPTELAIRHGPHSGADYFREVMRVKHWLEDNPHEFLIIDAKCEKKVSPEQRTALLKFMAEKFSKYLITKADTDSWFQIEHVTIGDIQKHYPKRVLLLVDDMVSAEDTDQSLAKKGFIDRKDFIVSKWHNTGSVKKLFERIAEDVQQQAQVVDKFVNLQLILTPKVHAKALANYCIGADRFRVDQKHYLLFRNKQVHYFIRSQAQHSLNYVMMDFVNYDPQISNFLIGLNFPYNLTIHDCYLVAGKSQHDVTKAVRELVTRGNSLWLISVSKDLGLKFDKADLHIVYEYEKGRVVHKKVHVKRTDQYLLNCITHLDVTLDVAGVNERLDISLELGRRKSSFFKMDSSGPSERSHLESRHAAYRELELDGKPGMSLPTEIGALKQQDPAPSPASTTTFNLQSTN